MHKLYLRPSLDPRGYCRHLNKDMRPLLYPFKACVYLFSSKVLNYVAFQHGRFLLQIILIMDQTLPILLLFTTPLNWYCRLFCLIFVFVCAYVIVLFYC